MGFDKKRLESIAAALSERKNVAHSPLFRANESVPELKPG
jgi:hypothetical protein